MAPSIVDGKPYAWAIEIEPRERLPEPPRWLLALIANAPAGREVVLKTDGVEGVAIIEGARNATLTSLAGSLRRIGLSPDAIEAALRLENVKRCRPELPASEIATIARSVGRYAPDGVASALAEGALGDDDQEMNAQDNGPSDPGQTPAELLSVPGFIDDVVQYTLDTAPYPERSLAFGGALGLQAFLASRKVRDDMNNRTSLYVVNLASSGAGKNRPRAVNIDVLHGVGLSDAIGDTISSSESIEDKLFTMPACLLQIDEFHALLNAIRSGREQRYEMISATLLKLFTSANTIYPLRIRAGQEARFVDQPGLTLYGTAIPQQFYGAMSPRMLTDGLFARLIVLEAGLRGRGQETEPQDVPRAIVDAARHWADFFPGESRRGGNLAAWHPQPILVAADSAAKSCIAAFRADADREYSSAESEGDEVAMAIWARASEKQRRLALNYACSQNHLQPAIQLEAAEWSANFVRHQTRRMLWMASSHVCDSDFDAKQKKALRVIRDHRDRGHGDGWMPAWKFNRGTRGWTPRDREEVVKSLEGQGLIDRRSRQTDGRPGESLRIKGQ